MAIRFHSPMNKKDNLQEWQAKRQLSVILPIPLPLPYLAIRTSRREYYANYLEGLRRIVRINLREDLDLISMFVFLGILQLPSLSFFSKSIKLPRGVSLPMEGDRVQLDLLPM